MDPIQTRLDALEKKIDAMYVSVEKLRKYFFWTGVITLAVIVLPLLFIPFAIAQLMSVYGNLGSMGI